MRAEHLADGGENLIDRVEADAADEMNVHVALLPLFRRKPRRHIAKMRGARQRCFGLVNEPAHNLGYRKYFVECRRRSGPLLADTRADGQLESLTTIWPLQAVTVARAPLRAWRSIHRKRTVVNRAQHRRETDGAGNRANVVENIELS